LRSIFTLFGSVLLLVISAFFMFLLHHSLQTSSPRGCLPCLCVVTNGRYSVPSAENGADDGPCSHAARLHLVVHGGM
jgi:hypothetical protein